MVVLPVSKAQSVSRDAPRFDEIFIPFLNRRRKLQRQNKCLTSHEGAISIRFKLGTTPISAQSVAPQLVLDGQNQLRNARSIF